MVNEAKNDISKQQLKLLYSEDPVAFVNDWCTTFDPRRNKDQYMPFILFQRQIEFIQFLKECVDDKENGLVEKSRDVGASWLCCCFAVWLLLFRDGSTVLFGSRVADLVDKLGVPDSLFEKIRIIINNLPSFLLPDRELDFGYMKIVNSENGSSIVGGSGDNIGRGGRSTLAFLDESAHYEHPEMIEAAISANTDVQIDISSVNGNGNVFYRRRMAGEIWHPDYKVTQGKTRIFIFDWRDNPMKDQAWYEEKRKKAEDEGMLHIFAQEVDRDYSASLEGIIIPAKWVKAAIDAHLTLKFPISGEQLAALDVADEGGDKNALVARKGVTLTLADHWGEGDTGKTARRAVDASVGLFHTLYYDAIGVGAGVKAETNRLLEMDLLPKNLKIYPWIASQKPLDPDGHVIPLDDKSPTNNDLFKNLKAQSWWRLRTRFEKTYRFVTQGIRYPEDELISIPSNLPNRLQLEQELSQVVYKKDMAGKIMIDKKPAGTKSPNLADAMVMAYNPCVELNSFDVL